ncbi:hypothetical protein EYF80_061654 [Liparis tanakae]|uniref:Uncharacterized protein n=1 Tax=Liparis tanakae TaxID=230148 RepID=A0A4Z2EHD5_9TELE|nr:hypothetical protein EYF80_061654 [Liparis tanakae]
MRKRKKRMQTKTKKVKKTRS